MLKGDINTLEFEHLDCKKENLNSGNGWSSAVLELGRVFDYQQLSNQTLKELAGFIKVPVKKGWSQRRLFEISHCF
jgi:hypothetical protein